MSDRKPKRNFSKRAWHLISLPFHEISGSTVELWDSLKEIGMMLVPHFGSDQRNRSFEEAGRESNSKLVRRRADAAVFHKGDREREQELIEAERENRKFSNANSEEAIHYRQQMERQKRDVSRGEIVNHLAKINAKHRQPESKDHESDK